MMRRKAVTVVSITWGLVALVSSGGIASGVPTGATPDYQLFFGDLHAHTDYSDGKQTPWDAFEAGRDAGADFMATTDHVHYPYGPTSLTPALWADTLAAADAYTEDGAFVALAGYELWLPEAGEVNVFNTDEVYGQTGNPAGRGFDNGLHTGIRRALPRLYDWLAATGAIGQWNHPWEFGYGVATTPLEEFFGFDGYSASRDEGMALVEAYNDGSYEDAYVRALDAGWHVMPAANSDTHDADWITGSEVRTVLLAEELTADDLFDAMRASRGYATQDHDLEIRYTLNGGVMGSTVPSATSLDVVVDIHDPGGAGDAITLIEVVSDGGEVVASEDVDSADVHWSTTVTSATGHYFFVRVSTASDAEGNEGVTAWTAPVWVAR